ncbi:hypothetical protein HDE_06446 [Halotydeus destructor]|nr:hypothetical protein HDE_06446 [Halotydeus destructor]
MNSRFLSTAEDEKQRAAALRSETEFLQTIILGGKPGVAFPNYLRAPRTKFSCKSMAQEGMYADIEARCQSYHMCHGRRMDTFLCPTGTLFHQATMTCDFWYNVNCDDSDKFFNTNVDVYNSYQPSSTTYKPRPRPTRVERRTTFVPRSAPTSVPAPRPAGGRPPVAPRWTTESPAVSSVRAISDEGPDWVYAWLKTNNKTSDKKADNKMSLQDFPLFANDENAFGSVSSDKLDASKAKPDQASYTFSVSHGAAKEEQSSRVSASGSNNLDKPNAKPDQTNYSFSVSHEPRKEEQLARASGSEQPTFVASKHNELTTTAANQQNPWSFPIDPEIHS